MVYLELVITKLFYFGVQTLGGRGGPKSLDRIHTFVLFFNDDLPNLPLLFPGFTYDFTSTCTCIPEEENHITKLVTDERVVRSESFDTDDKKNIELIIISALGGISTVFFMIIISLINSINILRRKLRSIRQNGNTLDNESAELYSEQCLLTSQNH